MDPGQNFAQGSRAPRTRDIVARTIGLGSGKQWDKLEYIAGHNPKLLQGIHPGGAIINQAYIQVRRVEVMRHLQEAEWPTGKYRIIGDCLEILPTLPDNSIDVLLTDPLYSVMDDYEWDKTEVGLGMMC